MKIVSDLAGLAEETLTVCRNHNVMISTAESCTGGLVGGCLTAIPGSSDVVDRGFITYSYDAKTDLLGVSADLLRKKGAVCAEVAEAMATGTLRNAPKSGVSVSLTGVAGPGASEDKPAGLVYIGCALRGEDGKPDDVVVEEHRFSGDRDAVRHQSVAAALNLVKYRLNRGRG